MKLSRTVSYAVQATLQLAEAKGETPIPCSRLAAEGGMPERFLLQILRSLVTRGILGSTRGVEGGYRLERSAEEISLLDVIEAIDGPMNSALPMIEGLPPACRMKLESVVADITDLVRRELQSTKLADLLPSAGGHRHRAAIAD